LRLPSALGIIAYISLYELITIYRRRFELVLTPIITIAMAMAITPMGLSLYGSSIELHKVVISGIAIAGTIAGSAASSSYYMVEASLEAFEKLLQVPAPRWAILAARSISASTIGIPITVVAITLASPYIGFSILSLAAAALASYMLSLGVIGVVSTAGYFVKNLQRLSLAVSIASSALSQMSPLYYPLDVLPGHIRLLVMLNPASLAVELLRRSILLGSIDLGLLPELALINTAWLSTGFYAMLKKIERR